MRVVTKDKEYKEPLCSWIADRLHSGNDSYDSYKIEDQLERVELAFGKLVDVLAEKGILTKDEVFDLISHYYSNLHTLEKGEEDG
jgi:hypothetical protein